MSSNVPQQLYDEAAELNLRTYDNWSAWEEVIRWADGWIARLASWPDEPTEISLNGRHKDSGARAALAQLAEQGHFDAVNIGKSPHEIISSLYPLTYDKFQTGGRSFDLPTPEPLRTALYKLNYAQESVHPEYDWADVRAPAADAWLSEEIRRELGEALEQCDS